MVWWRGCDLSNIKYIILCCVFLSVVGDLLFLRDWPALPCILVLDLVYIFLRLPRVKLV